MPRTWIPAPAKGMAIGDTDPSFAAEIKNYVFQQDGSLLVCPAPSVVSSETWTDYGLPLNATPVLVGSDTFILMGVLKSQGKVWTKITALSDDNVAYDITSHNATCIFFKPDGTKLYAGSHDTNDGGAVSQHSLSTAWDLSTASQEKKINVSETVNIGDIAFRPDGRKMYIASFASEKIYQYSLSTAWDIATASYEKVFTTSFPDTPALAGLFFALNGSKMYVVDQDSKLIHEYNLSTPWDIGSAVLYASLDVSAQATYPKGLAFSPNGAYLYTVEGEVTPDVVYVYSLSTPWDISTASYDSSVSLPDISKADLAIKSDGGKAYIAGGDKVHQFSATVTSYNDFSHYVRFYNVDDDVFEDYGPQSLSTSPGNFAVYNIPVFNPYSTSTVPWAFIGGWGNQRSIKIKVSSSSTWRYLGIEAPTQAPSAAVGDAGSLDGTYYFRYTYYDSSLDIESNGSPASDAVTVANQEVDLSNIAGTGEPGVDKIRIYGLGGSVTEYMLIATIDNPGEGQTTSYTVSTAESEWGLALATFRGTTYAFDQQEAFQVVGPINDVFELRKVADIGIISPTAIEVTNAGIMGITPSKTVFLFAGGFAKSIGEQVEPFLKGEYLPSSYYGYNLWVVSQAGDKGFVTIAEVAQDGSELDIKSIYTFILHSEGKWTMDGHGYMAFCDDPQFQPPDITTGSSYWGDNDVRRGLRLIAMLPNGKPYYYYLSPQATYPDDTSPSPDSLRAGSSA